jgi:DNA-binding transcriptional regulator YiaG
MRVPAESDPTLAILLDAAQQEPVFSKWERGEKHPKGASLKLLSLVDKKGLEVVA